MKKISFALLTLSVLSLGAKSQIRFGVNAGVNLASTNVEANNIKASGDKSIIGFKFGGVASVPVTGNISFMPELNIVKKGGKNGSTTVVDLGVLGKTTTEIKNQYKPAFVEIPLNVVYHAGDQENGGFFAGLGPVLSLGIGGNADISAVTTSVVGGNTTKTSFRVDAPIKFDGKKNNQSGSGTSNLHLKGFELGGNVFAGYRLSNGFFARASYNMGFSNLSPDDKSSFKTSYFGIGLGYFFNSK